MKLPAYSRAGSVTRNQAVIGRALTNTLRDWLDKRDVLATAKNNFENFVSYVGLDETGNALEVDAYVRIMGDIYSYCHKQGVHVSHVAPPGTGKSTIARLFLLFLLGHDVTLRTVVASGSVANAKNSVTLCRSVVTSQQYRLVFPNVVPDYQRTGDFVRGFTMSEWYVVTPGQAADPTMAAVSAKPLSENRRADILLSDDFMSRMIAESDELRQATENAFNYTWLDGRLAHGGWCLNLQNCWTSNDLAHKLLANERFCSVWLGTNPGCDSLFLRLYHTPADLGLLKDPANYGAEEVATSHPNCVEFRLPLIARKSLSREAALARQRDNLSSHRRLFELIAVSQTDKAMPSWDSRETRRQTVPEMLGLIEASPGRIVMDGVARNKFIIGAGLDLSGLGRKGCALWALAKDAQGFIYPLRFARGAWTVAQMVREVDDLWRDGVQFNFLAVEDVGVQDLIKEAIRSLAEDSGCPWAYLVQPHNTNSSNKWSAELGLPALNVDFESKRIIWPALEAVRRDYAGAEAWRELESQIAQLTVEEIKKQTPDGLMAFWFAWVRLRHMQKFTASQKPKATPYRPTRDRVLGGF